MDIKKKQAEFAVRLHDLIAANKAIGAEIMCATGHCYAAADEKKTFGTTVFLGARQSGKTTFIIENAKPGDLVVTADQPFVDQLIARGLNAAAATAQALSCDGTDWDAFETIYIDEPRAVFRIVSEDVLYERLATQNPSQHFVMLGSIF